MNGNKKQGEPLFIISLLLGCASIALITIFLILTFLLLEGAPAFTQIGVLKFLTGKVWNPTGLPPRFGALPLIVGTFLVTTGASLISVPLGIGTAIFISEIAPSSLKSFLKNAIEMLAGIPSVVYGFFGLVVLTNWIRITFGIPSGECWLAGSIILGIMALPTIISVAEDAISAVPKELKEGAIALGATKWHTIKNVVLPCAKSGITAAVILGMGRAIGETMAVMMVTGNSPIIPQPITNVFSPIRTITGTLGIEMGEVPSGSLHYHALFGLALVLFTFILAVNFFAKTLLSETKKGVGANFSWKHRKFRKPIILMLLLGAGFVIGKSNVKCLVIILLLASVITLVSRFLKPKLAQIIAFTMITLSALAVVSVLLLVITDIVKNGIPAITIEFLTQFPQNSGRSGGIFPAIIGTLYLVGGAIGFALPLGVGAAVYFSEFASDTFLKKVIRAGVEYLNGTPSIVFGLFGFALLVRYLKFGISLLAGQITLALMVLPTVIRTTEEALKTVPPNIKEASLSLGATRWQTVYRVVLPAAAPGILTGAILSIGRAAGETAPIMFTAAVFTQRHLPSSLLDPVMALPFHLFVLTTSIPGAIKQAYGTALVLLLLVAGIQTLATFLRNHYKKRLKW